MSRSDEEGSRLRPVEPGSPVLVYAVSGLGKSTLAAASGGRVCDADEFLYDAVAAAFPAAEPRARLRLWRELCQRRPWTERGADFDTWASVRRAAHAPIATAMQGAAYRIVVTSLLDPPWFVSAYYGVERGRYLEHLRLAGRETDNGQSEAMNDRLEGYAPVVRMSPGAYLGDRPEIVELLAEAAVLDRGAAERPRGFTAEEGLPRGTAEIAAWLGGEAEFKVREIRQWHGDAATVAAMERVRHLPLATRGPAFFRAINEMQRQRELAGAWPATPFPIWSGKRAGPG